MVKRKIPEVLQMSLSGILTVVLLLSSLPFSFYSTAAETPSQTKTDITEFQKERWTQIQNSVFGTDSTDVQDVSEIKDLSVQKGNDYFNWTDTSNMQGYDESGNTIEGGLKKYSGTPETVTSSGKITEKYSDSYVNYQDQTVNVTSSATYTVYNVYTADQFAWVLKTASDSSIKLNLLADIDMGGVDNKEFYTDKILKTSMFIEGNGHTVYNLKMYGTGTNLGLFNIVQGRLIVKNIGLQSIMLFHKSGAPDNTAGLFFGYCRGSCYFDNVHLKNSFYQQNSTASNEGIALLGGKSNCSMLLFAQNEKSFRIK